MSKTKITAHDDRHVTITFTTLDTDQAVQMDIWAPAPGKSGTSYVRYNGDNQLCAGLSSRGETLSYCAGTKLVDLVRREYRAMRSADKREIARYALS